MTERLRLGVNIDHVATLRNARKGGHPDPLRAADVVARAGGDSITAHLREDRRHILDADITALARKGGLPLNLEMAATPEMRAIALGLLPHAVCLVPERRQELTTEGGLDAVAGKSYLAPFVAALEDAKIAVALFIDPDFAQVDAAKEIGASAVELHTGCYCDARATARENEFGRLVATARHATAIGLECHAGHGLCFDTVGPVAAIPEIIELNIGHFLIGEAVFMGLEASILKMRAVMDAARDASASGMPQRASI